MTYEGLSRRRKHLVDTYVEAYLTYSTLPLCAPGEREALATMDATRKKMGRKLRRLADEIAMTRTRILRALECE